MNKDRFKKHLNDYLIKLDKDNNKKTEELRSRNDRKEYYQSWTENRIKEMTPEELYEFMAKLWAMKIWRNKRFYIEKIINDNGLNKIRENLFLLMWGPFSLEEKWNHFKMNVKGFGPAMMSEILAHVHPNECIVWNRRAFVSMQYLGVDNLPFYNYQVSGKVYSGLSNIGKEMLQIMREVFPDADLLTLDYFFWDELQVAEKLTSIKEIESIEEQVVKADKSESVSIHNEIRDKIAEIGQWLGFESNTEVKVADGAKVDAIWESMVGNLGRIIYVFEVQTKGSLDSLAMNLMKSLNNPAVQGVVAVSDFEQLEKLKRHISSLKDFSEKIIYWDYENVYQVHHHLSFVQDNLNRLHLVPEGF